MSDGVVEGDKHRWRYVEGLFCPNCGNIHVYCETGRGDYYVGPTFLCRTCGHSFYLSHGTGRDEEGGYLDSDLKALRDADHPCQ